MPRGLVLEQHIYLKLFIILILHKDFVNIICPYDRHMLHNFLSVLCCISSFLPKTFKEIIAKGVFLEDFLQVVDLEKSL